MPLSRIIVVGNDDIAVLAADLLARAVRPPFVAVHLLRPDEPVSAWSRLAHGATLLPETAELWVAAGHGELDLIRAARGSFLVGSVMRGFAPGEPAFLPFGAIGEPAGQVGFHHLVARRRQSDPALPLSAFMGGALAAQARRFAPPPTADALAQAAFNYGLHVAAEPLAEATAEGLEALGVTVGTGAIALIERDPAGRIDTITTHDGAQITGDLFVDCDNWLDDDPPVVDWSAWLPCNRIASVMRPDPQPPSLAMQLQAHPAGWQRQASLNGALVDTFVACDQVPGEIPAQATAFRPGRCATPWRGNCVAIGDGAVIIDPVSDIRLPLAVAAIARLAGLLPGDRDQDVEAREYNRQTIAELDHARDFAAAHYCLSHRTGDPFWDRCRAVAPPDTLQARIELYRDTGRIAVADLDPYGAASWIALFDALGVRPERYDTLADYLDPAAVDQHLHGCREQLLRRVAAMPLYGDTISHAATLPPQ